MSAVLIDFPASRIVRGRAQKRRQAVLLGLARPEPERGYPKCWSASDQYFFDYFRDSCGHSVEESLSRVEAHIHIGRTVTGETRDQRSLRTAQEAFAQLKPLIPTRETG